MNVTDKATLLTCHYRAPKFHAKNHVSGLIMLKSKNVQYNGLTDPLQQATKDHFQHKFKKKDNVQGLNFMLHIR
jgi:hypothetical protein